MSAPPCVPEPDCYTEEPMPETRCPRCGEWEEDHDGFGVLAHIGPGYKKPCGYCSHPSTYDGRCGICGEVRP